MHPAPDRHRLLAWSEWALFAVGWPIVAVVLWIIIMVCALPLWGGEPPDTWPEER